MAQVSQKCSSLPTLRERFQCVQDKIIETVSRKKHYCTRPIQGFPNWFSLGEDLRQGDHHPYPGAEQCLEKEVLLREDRSIELNDLFDISYYRCCNKKIGCAISSSYSVLQKGNYSRDRNNLPIQKKMSFIRHGDNFGAMYHFFGAAVMSYKMSYTWGWMAMRVRHFFDQCGRAASMPEDYTSADYDEYDIDMWGVDFGSELQDKCEKPTPTQRIANHLTSSIIIAGPSLNFFSFR